MTIARIVPLLPLFAHAHPGHDPASESALHWFAQHAPEIAATVLAFAAVVATIHTLRRRARSRR